MRAALDVRLCFVCSTQGMTKAAFLRRVEEALEGGVTMLQLREKTMPFSQICETARWCRELCQKYGAVFVVNDNVEVSRQCGADGVHLGQNDTPWQAARDVLGPAAIIGLTVETPAQAAAAVSCDVDYLGVSSIFASVSKFDLTYIWGLQGLQKLRQARDASGSRQPLVAIGGITLDNAVSVMRAGADGLAVISAIAQAVSPKAAARALRDIVDTERCHS